VRGPRGGYELARERRRITVGDIVRIAMSLSTADPDDLGSNSVLLERVIDPAIRRADETFLANLDAITVEQMCDISGLQLIERKALLEPLLANKPGLQFNGHETGDGELILKHAGKLGFEGVVSKTVDAPYAPGNRGLWRKAKWLNRQEFVIVGWSDPERSRPHLGALLLGYYTDDGKLIYAGRVGTGMPVKVLADLRRDWTRSLATHRL
jgi:hypothetical protein